MALSQEDVLAKARSFMTELQKGGRYVEVKLDFNVKEGDAGSKVIDKLGRLQLYNGNLAIIYARSLLRSVSSPPSRKKTDTQACE